jgi:hypothetical protein
MSAFFLRAVVILWVAVLFLGFPLPGALRALGLLEPGEAQVVVVNNGDPEATPRRSAEIGTRFPMLALGGPFVGIPRRRAAPGWAFGTALTGVPPHLSRRTGALRYDGSASDPGLEGSDPLREERP